MTASRRDIIAGGLFGAVAIVLFTVASGYPLREGQSAAIGPGFYPKILAVFMAVLSVIQIIQAVAAEAKMRKESGSGEEALPPVWRDRNSLVLFSITVASLVAYPFVMQLAGFAVTGFLFLGTLIYALSAGFRRGKALAFVAVVTLAITILTFLVFRLFLKIPFPSGIIRF